jgi:hypothetical protein
MLQPVVSRQHDGNKNEEGQGIEDHPGFAFLRVSDTGFMLQENALPGWQ